MFIDVTSMLGDALWVAITVSVSDVDSMLILSAPCDIFLELSNLRLVVAEL